MWYDDELVDERIRSALRRDDDADWRDVRRRARRKLAPRALAVGASIALLLAAPAVAFSGQLDHLWAQAEPEKNLYVRAIAECGDGTFTLELDPKQGATVREDGRTLAQVTVSEREIACEGPIRPLKSTPEAAKYTPRHPTQQRDGAAELTCDTNVPLEVAVNPIWRVDSETSEATIAGSTLVVAERGTKRLLASAVVGHDPYSGVKWSHAYWDSNVCVAQ